MHDELGDRMKENYEDRFRFKLLRRMPVIIRVDGKAFHTFCKRFQKPHDPLLHNAFNATALALCKEVSGTQLAEHHSDEISLLVTDYAELNTEAYFDNNLQKIVSVVAGIATAEFCRAMMQLGCIDVNDRKNWPSFDCRAFNIPREEVSNYFWWRNLDAVRNSIAMWAQSKFSHRELHGKNTSEMQEMMFQKDGFNWASLPQELKSGWLFYRETHQVPIPQGPDVGKMAERSEWVIKPAFASHTGHATFMSSTPLDF